MNIFEAIRKDHDTQRDLLKKLVNTEGDTKKRDTLFKSLKKELDIHANGEERHFYKPLISNDMMQEKARHGIAYDSSAWLKIAKNLRKKVEHHLEDEEHTFFQLAGKVFSDNQKQTLAKDYMEYMKSNL